MSKNVNCLNIYFIILKQYLIDIKQDNLMNTDIILSKNNHNFNLFDAIFLG